MTGPITVETLDTVKPEVVSQINRARQQLRGLVYADLRLEVREAQAASAENGQSKQASRDATVCLGIRALAAANTTLGVLAEAKARQSNLRQRDADVALALATDHLARRHVLA